MVGFICFFTEEHLWSGCGAPFLVVFFCIDVCLGLRFCALFDLSLDKIVLRPAINVLRKI